MDSGGVFCVTSLGFHVLKLKKPSHNGDDIFSRILLSRPDLFPKELKKRAKLLIMIWITKCRVLRSLGFALNSLCCYGYFRGKVLLDSTGLWLLIKLLYPECAKDFYNYQNQPALLVLLGFFLCRPHPFLIGYIRLNGIGLCSCKNSFDIRY